MKSQNAKTFGTLGTIFLLASFGFVANVMGYGGGGGGPVSNGGGGVVFGASGPAFNWATYTAPVVISPNGQVLGASTTASTTLPAGFKFNVNLGFGSRHVDVKNLQSVLISGGFLRGGSNTGYFGPLTMSAVRSYQTRNGITPASGYVGPKTRAFLNK